MKSDKRRNTPERSGFEKEVRQKIREALGDLKLGDAGEAEAVETWLFQKLTHLPEDQAEPAPVALPRPAVKPHDGKPMSRRKLPLNYHPVFSKREHEKLKYGFLPLSVEDKWFVCLEDGDMGVYRNSTRACIYELQFEKKGAGFRVRETWVDPEFIEQNEWNSPAYAERLLDYIIQRLLLGRLVKFPFPARMRKPTERSMLHLGLMGANLANDERTS